MADTGKGHRQRLKERFLAGEPSSQSDEALLELLLTYAIPQKDVQPLARHLIA
jgi:DNA repair protein RadC